MEGEGTFTAALTEVIERRHQYIENTELPKLKDRFRVFHASLQSLISMMVRKGLIQEDPYKTEHKISGISMAEDTEFNESELVTVIGIRMAQLDNVLEYANNYVEFTVAALSFEELKKLAELARYVAWDDLKTNSPRPTTRAIAGLMGKFKMGSDSFASGILGSALKQLSDGCLGIIDQLKVVRAFQRERYKLDLRIAVFPGIENAETLKADDRESLKRVRAAFAQSGMAGPFLPELASEVIAEDNAPDSAERRSATLESLQTRSDVSKTKASKPVSLNQVLIDAVRSLAASSRSLDAALERLRENASIIQSRRRGLGSRLRDWFAGLFKRQTVKNIYELEFMDEATGTRVRESVDLDGFLEMLHKKAQTYGNLLSKSGSLWTKIEKAEEEQLYQFVNKELGDLHLIHRRAGAFDSYFKAQTTRDEKRRLRGIKIELTTMRNSIAKAGQLKHEYVSRKEEQEQLQKLGIQAGDASPRSDGR